MTTKRNEFNTMVTDPGATGLANGIIVRGYAKTSATIGNGALLDSLGNWRISNTATGTNRIAKGINLTTVAADISGYTADTVLAGQGTAELEMSANTTISLNALAGMKCSLYSDATDAGVVYETYTILSNTASAGSKVKITMSGVTGAAANGKTLFINAPIDVLLQGIYRSDAHGFTVGSILYSGEAGNPAAGGFTTTAPSTSGDYVHIAGFVVSANLIYFNPSNDFLEIA